MKKSFILLLALIFFIFPNSVMAVITKTSGDLELTCNEPVFSSDILWYPGLEETAPFQVRNKGEEIQKLMLKAENISDADYLSEVFYIKITKDAETLYGNIAKTLVDFFAEDEVFLSEINKETSEEYQIEIEMDKEAGNKWQDKSLSFDFKFWFSGKEAAAVTVVGISAPEPAAAPVCTATTPTSAPILSVTGVGFNSVSLSWTSVSPATHYLIAYGLSSGSYIYGNPNIGNVTSFTVSGLSGGTTYYFAVKGVNDCAPGPYSNEVSATPTGPIIVGPPPGFAPILGIATPSAELEEEVVEGELPGEVAGAEVKRVCPWWWVLLLLQTIIQTVYYYLISKKEIKQWWIFPLVVSIVAFFAHEKLQRGYLPSRFCPYFWLLDLLILAISTSGYYWLKKKES